MHEADEDDLGSVYIPQHKDRLGYEQFVKYPVAPTKQLLSRLAYVLNQIQNLVGDIALCECSGQYVRVHTFQSSRESSVQARDREASFYALQLTNELIELRAAREIYIIERDFIQLLLSLRGSDAV